MVRKSKPKLTPQQRALVKNLVKGMSITDAALKAGYSENCPGQVGSQALAIIKQKMPELMDNIGLTDERLLTRYLKPALDANETKFFQKDGLVTDTRDVIAWGPRLTALDLAFNLKGCYAPKGNLPILPIAVQIVTNVNFADPHA